MNGALRRLKLHPGEDSNQTLRRLKFELRGILKFKLRGRLKFKLRRILKLKPRRRLKWIFMKI